MWDRKVSREVFSLFHVSIRNNIKNHIGICLVFLLLLDYFRLTSAYLKHIKEKNAPHEKIYFLLDPATGFHKNLKYPPYRQCEHPKRVFRRKVTNVSTSNKWRSYWATAAWGRYFLEFTYGVQEWERTMEFYVKSNPVIESGLPILWIIVWAAIIAIINLLAYPLASMLLFRGMLLLWGILSHRRIRKIFRKIIILHQKYHRRHILRVFQDAGRRPPFSRYSLPWFVRTNAEDVVPKELDETDEEFWSTDDEYQDLSTNNTRPSQAAVGTSSVTKAKARLEVAPEYALTEQDEYLMSEMMNKYMAKVSKHGMFAVWTDGVHEIDLEAVSQISHQKKPETLETSKRLSRLAQKRRSLSFEI